MTKRASGNRGASICAASRNCSRPFWRVRRDTTITTGEPAAMPSSRRTRSGSGRSEKRSSSTPFGMTTIFAGSYPSLVSQSLTASAFTSTQSAKRQTNRCTRFCIGVRYAARSRIDAITTGVPASRDGQNPEDVAVKAVGMHHVDALLCHVARELRLLRHRRETVEAGDGVIGQRDAAVAELLDERTDPAQARHLEAEALLVERSRERDGLILGTAAQQRRHDLQ